MSVTLAALAALGSIAATGIGAAASAKKNKEAQETLESDRRRDREYYTRLLDRDYINTPENESLLRRMQEMQRANYDRARAINTVAGGTDASLAAMQAAGNDTVARVAEGIGARAGERRDRIQAASRASEKAYNQQMFGLQRERANVIANAAGQATKAMAGIAGASGSASNPYGDARYAGLSQDEALALAQANIDAQTAVDLAGADSELENALKEIPVFGKVK